MGGAKIGCLLLYYYYADRDGSSKRSLLGNDEVAEGALSTFPFQLVRSDSMEFDRRLYWRIPILGYY